MDSSWHPQLGCPLTIEEDQYDRLLHIASREGMFVAVIDETSASHASDFANLTPRRRVLPLEDLQNHLESLYRLPDAEPDMDG